MTRLLHIAASPRGKALEWSLPEFGLAAVGAKMAVSAGETPSGEEAAAWRAARDTFTRIDTIRFSPDLVTADAEPARQAAHAATRELGGRF